MEKKRKPKEIDIIYEDDYIVAVNKEAGMLTIPDRYSNDQPNLKTSLERKYNEIFIVHRLDKFTSGTIVFCKTADAHQAFSTLWMEREIQKIYVAICEGNPIFTEKMINEPIREHGTKKGQFTVGKVGKPSRTQIKIREKFKTYSLVEADLLTGRTHQIRVHLKHIGLPIVADAMYGQSPQFFLSSIKRKKFNLKKDHDEIPIMSRQALHAEQLNFEHPFTNEKITLSSGIPKDMRATLNQMRKWNKLR